MSQFGPLASGLFSDGGANLVIVSASATPSVNQVLQTTSSSVAEWNNISNSLTAGLGIDATELTLNIIQLDVTPRFTFSGNSLDLTAPVTVPFGGTGLVTLTSNGVLVGQGAAAVDTSKQAPTGDFVGTTDVQVLTNKTMTDSTNDVTLSALFSNSGANTIDVRAAANPVADQVLTATGATDATWQDSVSPLSAGLGIDPTELSSNIIQLELSTRLTFSGNDLELIPLIVNAGGTGHTTLTPNSVLIGDGFSPVDISKQAPTGDFVGTTDTQILTNKTITDSTNDVTATGLFSNSSSNTVDVSASANPTSGQILVATGTSAAEWQDKNTAFYAYDFVGGVSVPANPGQITLVFDTELYNQDTSNFVYNTGTGELVVNELGIYEINYCVTVASDGTATPSDRSSVGCFLQIDTGGGFSGRVDGSFAFAYVREEGVNAVITTATVSIIFETTSVPIGMRIRVFQTNNTAMVTDSNASRFMINRLQ